MRTPFVVACELIRALDIERIHNGVKRQTPHNTQLGLANLQAEWDAIKRHMDRKFITKFENFK